MNKINRKNIRVIWCLVLSLFIGSTHLHAQFNEDYIPLGASGLIPADYLNMIKGEPKVTFKNSERLSKEEKNTFRKATNFSSKEIFIEGEIYIDEIMTPYIRSVANKILKGHPLENDVNIFISNSTDINANSWQNGTIVINIGLLSRLNNEDQLAFVLAHEIAHITLQHPYQQFADYVKLNNSNTAHSKTVKNSFHNHDLTLSYEIIADSLAVEYLYDAGFDGREAMRTLEMLMDEEERSTVNLLGYLSSEHYTLKVENNCTPKDLSVLQPGLSYNDSHFSDMSLGKRIEKVRPLVSVKDSKIENTDKVIVSNSFYTISKMAHFEVIYQAHMNSKHLKSIHEALILLKEFPSNKFLHKMVAQNILAISRYNNLGIIDRIYNNEMNQNNFEMSYSKLACLLFKASKNDELDDLSYGFVFKVYNLYPEDGDLIVAMAQETENVKGMDAAKPYYRKYIKLYPNGFHANFVKNKLK